MITLASTMVYCEQSSNGAQKDWLSCILFEGFLFLESREIEWKKMYRSPYEAYPYLSSKPEDLRCDFELMTDELASMTGLLRGYVQQLDVPEQPALTEELAKNLRVNLPCQSNDPNKINSHRGRNSMAFGTCQCYE